MYYVYLLRCRDESLYAGITTDLRRRLQEHSGGKRGARYTHAHPPKGYAAAWTAANRAEASRLEAHLKRLSREQKEAAIQDGIPGFAPAVLPEGTEAT